MPSVYAGFMTGKFMAYFLNNILLAKNGDNDVGMQMLVYIVFAALWIIGVISKKAQKKQQENQLQKQNKSEHPVSQTKEIPQPKGNIVHKFQQTPNSSKIALIKKLQSKIKKIKPPIVTETKKIPAMQAYTKPPEDQKHNYRQEMIADLTTDPDSLKKAILYHEILGKPIGLRDLI